MLLRRYMRKRNLAEWLVVLTLGTIGTVQYHRVQFVSRLDTFFGDRGDARGMVYFCEHWYQALLGKADLFSPGIFYPTSGTLAYTDLLLGYALPYSMLRRLGFGIFSSFEIVVIVVVFLTYVVSFILLNKILRFSLLPSCVGAMFFAFSSPKFFQLGHLQLQHVVFLPLIFILVISFAQRAGRISGKRAGVLLALAGGCLVFQLMTAFYHAWFLVFWSFLFFLVALLIPKTRSWLFAVAKQYWSALVVAAAVFLIGFITFLLIYLPTLRAGNWYTYANVSEMIPEWWGLLSMGDGNYVWGWLAPLLRPDPPPGTWGEMVVGVGLVFSITWVLLTIYAVWVIGSHSRGREAKAEADLRGKEPGQGRLFLAVMILATTLFYLLGVKYLDGYSPWSFVYKFFPGAGAIRAMSRYVIFLTLPMSIALAYALDATLRRITRRKNPLVRRGLYVAVVLLAGFGVFEQFGVFKVGGGGFSIRAEEAYLQAMANKLPDSCRAFYVVPEGRKKHNAFEYQNDGMLISALRGIPTLNGSSSQFPPNWFGLYEVKSPAYEENVRKWIELNNIKVNVCRLQLSPPVEAFERSLPNPIDDSKFFVSQHYLDFLDRQPTTEELTQSVDRLAGCQPADPACDRVGLSMQLFESTGFHDRGSLILRLYSISLGRMPNYEEFIADIKRLDSYGGVGNEGETRFIDEFLKRQDFVSRYEGLSDAQYLKKLLENSGVRSSNQLGSAMNNKDRRAAVLRQLLHNDEVSGKFANREFVTLHYFGYLRRDPEGAGFEQWLKTLNSARDPRQITSGFVNSSEYRERFGY